MFRNKQLLDESSGSTLEESLNFWSNVVFLPLRVPERICEVFESKGFYMLWVEDHQYRLRLIYFDAHREDYYSRVPKDIFDLE